LADGNDQAMGNGFSAISRCLFILRIITKKHKFRAFSLQHEAKNNTIYRLICDKIGRKSGGVSSIFQAVFGEGIFLLIRCGDTPKTARKNLQMRQ
jgi:hypothetical protein